MEHWVALVTQIVAVVIDAMAVVIIAIGTIEGFITGVRAMFFAVQGHDMRRAWLRYTRWLVAGLTFQLGADILDTAIAPGWEDIGRLAAIAVIRTFLNYFLERDIEDIRERDRVSSKEISPA